MLSSTMPKSFAEEFDISNSRKLLKSIPNTPPIEYLHNDISMELSNKFQQNSTTRKIKLHKQKSNIENVYQRTDSNPNTRDKMRISSENSMLLPKVRLSKSSESYSSNSISPKDIETEDKVSLFMFPSANILSFDEQLSESATSSSANTVSSSTSISKTSGRMLGHGLFEIFQLHGGSVTFLSCGSVIYPLLPKLKILRVSLNQFILPLVNPERYWQICISSADPKIISDLESILQKVCLYRNLYFEATKEEDAEDMENQVLPSADNDDNRFSDLNFGSLNTAPGELNQESLKCDSIRTTSSAEERNDTIHTVIRQSSFNSITSALASFNVESDSIFSQIEETSNGLHNYKFPPSPQNKSPMKRVSNTSLNSSLDSLIDEYEESVFNTVRISHLHSKKDSPATSQYFSTIKPSIQHENNYTVTGPSSRPQSLYLPESTWMEPDDMIESNHKLISDGSPYQSVYRQASSAVNGSLERNSFPSSKNNQRLRNITESAISHTKTKSTHHSPRSASHATHLFPSVTESMLISSKKSPGFGSLKPNDVYTLVSKSSSKLNMLSQGKVEKQSSFVYKLFGW